MPKSAPTGPPQALIGAGFRFGLSRFAVTVTTSGMRDAFDEQLERDIEAGLADISTPFRISAILTAHQYAGTTARMVVVWQWLFTL